MVFSHKSLAIAALALPLIPILIHLFSRRRPRRMRWAAMALLLAAHRRSARRACITRWALLTLRGAALLLIGLALARPLISANGLHSVLSGPTHHVLVLDNGLSMRFATPEGGTRFERGVRAALAQLDDVAANDPVTLITTSPAPRVRARLTHDLHRIRTEIAALKTTPAVGDIDATLRAVREVLADDANSGAGAVVYHYAAWPRESWQRASAEKLSHTAVQVIPCADGGEQNVAITRISAHPPRPVAGIPFHVEVLVTNHGVSQTSPGELQLLHEGRVVAQHALSPLGPGATEAVEWTVAAAQVGAMVYEAKLQSSAMDALPDDDHRFLALDVVLGVPVLLVEGRRGGARLEGDAAFLSAALAPHADGLAPAEYVARRIAAEELADESLDKYAMVALCNVPQLAPAAWNRLADYVRAGGGLFVACGPAIDPDAYLRASADLLPARPGEMRIEPDAERPLGFARPDAHDALLGAFSAIPECGLLRARVSGYLRVEEVSPAAVVHARFTDGAPALVTEQRGAGRVALLTTSVDMAWTNLPAKGDFVALARIIAGYLCGGENPSQGLHLGDELVAALSPLAAVQPVTVGDPRRNTHPAAVRFAGASASLHFDATEEPGAYRVSSADGERVWAVNIDPVGSNPGLADESALRAVLGENVIIRRISSDAAQAVAAGTRGFDAPLLWFGLLLLSGEMWLAGKQSR